MTTKASPATREAVSIQRYLLNIIVRTLFFVAPIPVYQYNYGGSISIYLSG
jgi:hypothetical protein